MRQYFIAEKVKLNEEIKLNEDISHHLKNVLRCKENDIIRLVDGNNNVFFAEIHIDDDCLIAKIKSETDFEENGNDIIYCACMLKRDKWEWLIQKAVELNATKIIPIISRRTIIKIDDEQIDKKVTRWNKIALEAAQQSNRNKICIVEKPIKLKDIIKYKSDINIVPYEKEKNINLIDIIDEKSTTFLIGPEGGFEESEIEFLEKNDFTCCSLGRNILRAETAGLYTLAVIDAKRSLL